MNEYRSNIKLLGVGKISLLLLHRMGQYKNITKQLLCYWCKDTQKKGTI